MIYHTTITNSVLKWGKKAIICFIAISGTGFLLMVFSAWSSQPAVQPLRPAGNSFEPQSFVSSASSQVMPPSLLFRDGTGKVIDVSDKKGKVIFINFWATWCPPCVAEMPSINRLYGQYKSNENVLFIMVDVDSDYAKAQKFLKKKQLDLPLYTPAGPIPSNMLGNSIPCTVVLDKAGEMAFRHEGAADYDNKKFKDAMQRLIEE